MARCTTQWPPTTWSPWTVGSKIMPLEFLTIYGNIRNLLDTQRIVGRRPYGARPNAPRWVQVGVKLEF